MNYKDIRLPVDLHIYGNLMAVKQNLLAFMAFHAKNLQQKKRIFITIKIK